mmetsp:Transcript_7324/g.12380  ORF Transcript_7324/g.12380 Transcript_7324/m.12380 type:complete len:112 (-) Transcript_7324:2161-2496(-)
MKATVMELNRNAGVTAEDANGCVPLPQKECAKLRRSKLFSFCSLGHCQYASTARKDQTCTAHSCDLNQKSLSYRDGASPLPVPSLWECACCSPESSPDAFLRQNAPSLQSS